MNVAMLFSNLHGGHEQASQARRGMAAASTELEGNRQMAKVAPRGRGELSEDEWRAEVRAGKRLYSAEEDAAYHAKRRTSDPPGSGPSSGSRMVNLANGEHAYFQSKPNGGFRLAFKPGDIAATADLLRRARGAEGHKAEL